jgi:hypothetical protein
MSVSEQVEVPCGRCGQPIQVEIWRSLNVSLDPERKRELLEGQLNVITCSHCGWVAPSPHDFLYHDAEQRLMLLLRYPDAEGVVTLDYDPFATTRQFMEGYRVRLVCSRSELHEKIAIFDAGLDDRVIELIKLEAFRDTPEIEGCLMWFRKVAPVEGEETVLFDITRGGDTVAEFNIPQRVYGEFASAWEGKTGLAPGGEPIELVRVDTQYVMECLLNLVIVQMNN